MRTCQGFSDGTGFGKKSWTLWGIIKVDSDADHVPEPSLLGPQLSQNAQLRTGFVLLACCSPRRSGDEEVQTCSYKINKSQGGKVQQSEDSR